MEEIANDLWPMICKHLDARDIVALRCTSRRCKINADLLLDDKPYYTKMTAEEIEEAKLRVPDFVVPSVCITKASRKVGYLRNVVYRISPIFTSITSDHAYIDNPEHMTHLNSRIVSLHDIIGKQECYGISSTCSILNLFNCHIHINHRSKLDNIKHIYVKGGNVSVSNCNMETIHMISDTINCEISWCFKVKNIYIKARYVTLDFIYVHKPSTMIIEDAEEVCLIGIFYNCKIVSRRLRKLSMNGQIYNLQCKSANDYTIHLGDNYPYRKCIYNLPEDCLAHVMDKKYINEVLMT